MGGTSMAAPLVSGCAALVRQYYVDSRHHQPSAALLRATLINGTRWLSGIHTTQSHKSGPANFDQGFGCIDISTTIPTAQNAAFVLSYVDNWQNQNGQVRSSGDFKRFVIDVQSNKAPLRICLCYTDRPGRALQNNLNLFVQSPDRKKHIGNFGLLHSLNIPDVDNNVEVVRILNPAPGRYLIQVTAQNILESGQDFALVVTGDLASDKLLAR
jgi:hypothetical protein